MVAILARMSTESASPRPPAVDPDAPAVILSPHLDDAVWSCFAILSGDAPVEVATIFAGIPPAEPGWWDRQCGITDSAEHVRNRRAEDTAVLASLGRHARHLPLLDDQYRDAPVPAERVVEELVRELPAVSRAYAPGGIGDHPDHLIGRDAGLLLARLGVPTTLYADYCYCTREGWPTWVAENGRPEADEQWRRVLGAALGDRIARPDVHRLSEPQSEAKLAAMRGYVTQFENIEAEEPRWQVDGKGSADPEKRVIEVYYPLPAA